MKKFLCYDTNDASSGKINVDSRGMLTPLSGTGTKVQSDLMETDETELSFVKGQVFGLKRVKLDMQYCEYSEGSQYRPKEHLRIVMYATNDLVKFSKICIKINDKKFDHMMLLTDDSSISGYYGDGSDYRTMWESDNGYGFRLEWDGSSHYGLYVDESRFGPIKDVNVAVYKYEIATLPSEYLPNPIPYDHLPLATDTTPGAVIVPTRDDLSGYTSCVVDANGAVYSKEFTPATVFSELSKTNLNNLISVGEHGLFTDSINEEISSVVELVLPVHAWLIKRARTKDYVLESADGTRVLLQLGNGFNYTNATILHQPSSGGSLIVTAKPDDSTHATHSPSEIYEAIQSGKTAQFCIDTRVFQLIGSTANSALFGFSGCFEDTAFLMTIGIDNNSEIITLGPAFVPQYSDGNCDSIVLNSSTDGSNKRFRIMVDDSGTLSATEVTS